MLVQINSLTEEQIQAAVAGIIAGVGGTNERDFVIASETYNSLFFKDLPPALVKAACSALNQHFVNNINNFWVNKSQIEFA